MAGKILFSWAYRICDAEMDLERREQLLSRISDEIFNSGCEGIMGKCPITVSKTPVRKYRREVAGYSAGINRARCSRETKMQ